MDISVHSICMQHTSDDSINDTLLGKDPNTLAEAEPSSGSVPDAVRFIRAEQGSGAGDKQSANRGKDEPPQDAAMSALQDQRALAGIRGRLARMFRRDERSAAEKRYA